MKANTENPGPKPQREAAPAEVSSPLRLLPSVDLLLGTPQAAKMISTYGRSLTVRAIRETLANVRSSLSPGKDIPAQD